MSQPLRQSTPARKPLVWLGALTWTILIGGVIWVNHFDHQKVKTAIGLAEARANFQKDLYYRFWSLQDKLNTRPSSASSVHDLTSHQFGLPSHLCIRKASRAENDPDEWESEALKNLEAGLSEVSELKTINGSPYLRYMGPLVTNQDCVNCHSEYKSGQLRGGLSVSVPLETAWSTALGNQLSKSTIIYGSLWLIGLAGFAWIYLGLQQEESELREAYAKLNANESRHKRILEHAPVAYMLLSESGLIMYANEAWVSLAGRPLESVQNAPFSSLIASSHQSHFKNLLPRLHQNGFINNEAVSLVRPDFSQSIIAINARVETDANSQEKRIHCTLRDITEQHRVQSALEQSEARYKLIADNTGDITLIYNNISDRIEYVSPSSLRVLGVRPEDAIGHHLTHFLAPESATSIWEEHRKRIAGILAGDHSQLHHAYEMTVLTPLGRHVPMEAQSTVILDEGGNPVRMICVIRDISKRRQSEKAMADTARRFRMIIEQGNAAYFRVNRQGFYEGVNQAWLDLHGYQSADEVIGKHFDSTQVPEDRSEAHRLFELVFSGQAIPPGELSRLSKDGTQGFHSYSIAPVLLDGELVGAEGFLIDTTQLRKAREDSAMLFNEMIDAFALHEIICDEAGKAIDFRYLAVNPAFERITGLLATKVIGRCASEVIPDIEPIWLERFGRVALSGESMSFEEYSKSFSLHLSVSAFQPAPGRFACVFLDISDRKKAEAKLESDEAELGAIHEHVPMMLILLDSQRKVRRFNRAAAEFASLNGIGDGTPDSPGLFIGCFQALSSGESCGQGPHCHQCPLRLAINDTLETGAVYSSKESTMLVVHGEHPEEIILRFSTARVCVGTEPMVLICMDDVTPLRETEQHIRRQAALLDITADSICVLSPSYTIEYWNRAAHRIFGWSEAEAIGCDWETLVFKKESPPFREAFSKTQELGEWVGELRALSKEGSPLILQARASLITEDPQHPDSILLVCTNITEAKRMEHQFLRMQRLDNLGSLASGIAHDLNNVLSPILMSADLLPPLIASQEHQPLVSMLRDSARRGAEIVQQLLIFSRGSDTPRIPLDASKLIREIGLIITQTFPRNIRLKQSCPEKLWQVMGDNTQLHQVLLNLCVNARDAMPEGGQIGLTAANCEVDEATATLHHGAVAGSYVVLKVSDTGEGIPAELLEKIFDPFFTTKPAGKGTGLGLSTVLAIVQSHGGFTTLSSQPTVGSEFKIYLPAALKPIAAPQITEQLPDLRGRGETILVIDDESNIKDLMKMALGEHNYKVLLASDGAQGLAVYADNPSSISAIFTDMMMPHLDGRLCIQCIRQINPLVPIIAMSGMHDQEHSLEKLGEPTPMFMHKPFTVKTMLSTLKEALNT